MTGAAPDASPRWSSALEALWAMNRVHCGLEMSAAYRELSEFYNNLEIFGFASGSKSGSWVAPPEWIVENTTLTDLNGKKLLIGAKTSYLYILSDNVPKGPYQHSPFWIHVYPRVYELHVHHAYGEANHWNDVP